MQHAAVLAEWYTLYLQQGRFVNIVIAIKMGAAKKHSRSLRLDVRQLPDSTRFKVYLELRQTFVHNPLRSIFKLKILVRIS